MYQGAFEPNYPSLAPGVSTYQATDGSTRAIPPWPDGVDGLQVGYMERAGKKFVIVRLQFDEHDIVLRRPVPVDTLRHLGGRHLSAHPTIITDDLASQVLDDAIGMNPDQTDALALLINRVNLVRRGGGPLP